MISFPDSFSNARVSSRQVEGVDIDELGHVNNVAYLRWVQDVATEHWTSIASEELKQQYKWYCSRHEIDYTGQLFEHDKVEIRTWLAEPRGARFDRFVDIRKSGEQKASVVARTTWVLIDSKLNRPVRVPNEIVSAFWHNG